ncbi:four helix bundle protein [Candidatus Roizmanbacteria bacterium]|nr:four helix bundle protein [Candidatus Roizmanbacteria bacterium]
MKNGKIQSFTDLNVWKEGHKLVVLVYKITESFPIKETYSLIDQMRRAVASITANIAEGFGRQSYKEKLQYYYLAQGSLTELKNFILIAKDVDYLKKEDFTKLVLQANLTHQILQGFIRKTKTFINPKS